MKTHTQLLYSFSSASITLRIIEHLHNNYQSTLDSVAVINLIDRWLVKINLKHFVDIELAKNLKAFLNEMGIVHTPSAQVAKALIKLEAGESPTAIMNHYQVVIVAYGRPDKEEIEIFREQIIERLGYCPQNMA